MKILVCGATGFIGRNLVPALLAEKHDITIVGRDLNKINKLFKLSLACATWENIDSLNPDTFDCVINLAGENIGEGRWTEYRKNVILSSRVLSTKAIMIWCSKSIKKKPHVYNASAIGVYGLQTSSHNLSLRLTEDSPVPIGKPRDFLSLVGQQWEQAATQNISDNQPVTLMRFGVVLQRGEAVLKKLELSFCLGLGSRIGAGEQAFTWIHIEDLIRGILYMINHPEIQGPVNMTSPQCVSQKVFAENLASVMQRPFFFVMPAIVVKMLFGQMGKELLLSGQNVYPKRLIDAGFIFRYPDINSALKNLWDNK